ncbi:hypothetical protein [Amycolatopsis rubida]|uniref:Uncharacterized protein n=1 Tax=Amycolatopsis rubida TaxID=112413 RepID=A0A1I5E333_9PSEU|nr:hypothetical protein [Amycolatopsis rubida]SFO05949.1 hypothetical protein SAMN05421854_101472 [Amycolatopsis rubida]
MTRTDAAAPLPDTDAAPCPFAGAFAGDLTSWRAEDTAVPPDGFVLLQFEQDPARVGIRRYSDDHRDVLAPPLLHAYLLLDLCGTWLAIHPLCAGPNATPHATQLIEAREHRSLGDDGTACPGCAAWLRDNAHVVVVGGADAVRGGPFVRVETTFPAGRSRPAPPGPAQRATANTPRRRPGTPAARTGAAAPDSDVGPGAVPARLAPAGLAPAGPVFAFPLIPLSPEGKGVSHTENRGALCVFED